MNVNVSKAYICHVLSEFTEDINQEHIIRHRTDEQKSDKSMYESQGHLYINE